VELTRSREAADPLLIDLGPDVVSVQLVRGAAGNPLTPQVIDGLREALDLAERTSRRFLTVSGDAGVFCTGMDLAGAGRSLAGSTVPASSSAAAFFDLLAALRTAGTVVVSLVDGTVAGGGTGLVAASDFVYATPRSTFALPEALWGLLPCCVLPFVADRVGWGVARELTLSTLPLSCPDAVECGLVTASADRLELPLRRLRQRVGRTELHLLKEAKRYLHRLQNADAASVRQIALDELDRLLAGERVQADLAAFATSGRLPWEGR
jgi:polyketide biosynthesis enoyl-CoA hydratase PksH